MIEDGGALYQLEDVSKRYGSGEAQVTALDGASLTVNAGEFVAVAGRSSGPRRRGRCG